MHFPSGNRSKIVGLLLSIAVTIVGLSCETVVSRNGWSDDWGPLVPHRTFPGDCGLCHVPERWDVLRADFSFDHEKQTGHPLVGAHAAAACLRCHNDRGPVSAYVARGCGGCHPDPHKGTLGLDCLRCHEESQNTWRPGGLVADHARTRFPLVGVHAATPCESCHPRAPVGDFRGAPVDCDLCHRADLARATNPDHVASGLTRECQRCHTPTDWSRATFSHASFPLTGGHNGLACRRCHTSGSFGPVASDCYACHRADYERQADHVASGFSHDCRDCHNTITFSDAAIDHSAFPLTGGHSGITCRQCHTSGTYGPIPTDCFSCHRADYERAPNHLSFGFPRDCTQCHNTNTFTGATFSHSAFPLRGPHDVTCTTCHPGASAALFTCIVCHAHAQSSMDSHHRGVSGYSYDSNACYRCHPNGTH
ncbi:MAG: hypothetical protein HYR85_07910 [Planctomycetes bacterium]|nr:hypothetical protein [Planctomycetota bacterium]MBI3848165.1 hypothetical protein [Planctomycetota bacterium]